MPLVLASLGLAWPADVVFLANQVRPTRSLIAAAWQYCQCRHIRSRFSIFVFFSGWAPPAVWLNLKTSPQHRVFHAQPTNMRQCQRLGSEADPQQPSCIKASLAFLQLPYSTRQLSAVCHLRAKQQVSKFSVLEVLGMTRNRSRSRSCDDTQPGFQNESFRSTPHIIRQQGGLSINHRS